MIAGSLFPIGFIDPPEILYTNVTPIPGSGSLPLQVVANSGPKASYGVSWLDTTGDYIGLYTGPSGQEVLRCIIGGGVVSAAPVVISANSRVSLRSMTATPITNGQIVITFLGQGWAGGAT
jgi:hypothetical protein